MTAAVAAHLRTSTLISIVISMVISAAFFLLVFRLTPDIAVFAPGGLALDFIPQTLAAGFMAAFIPALQTRAKIVQGQIPAALPIFSAIAGRALFLAVASLGLAAAIIAALWLASVQSMPWVSAFIIKIVYGGLLGLIITPIALRAILPKG